MPTQYSSSLRLALLGDGENAGTWGGITNTNLGGLIEQALTGVLALDMSGGDVTLTAYNGVSDQARNAVLSLSGTQTATNNVIIPNVQKTYIIRNVSASTVGVKVSGNTALMCAANTLSVTYCDGSGGVYGFSYPLGGSFSTLTVPSGAVFHFAMQTAPAGYLVCNGAAVSRTLYSSLFSAIGVTFGAGDATTTFNIPNLLGQFIRGQNNTSSGVDPNRALGSAQTDAYGAHVHGVTDPGHSHSYITLASGGGSTYSSGGQGLVYQQTNPNVTNISIMSSGSAETRPVNVALLPCIKT